MHGAAVQLSKEPLNNFDLLVCSDFLDLTTFKALARTDNTPYAVYFHENQITYPWSQSDDDIDLGRDNHYGWINFTSALAADACLFNSQYHLDSFVEALPAFLARFPDGKWNEEIAEIQQKSTVLHLGCDLGKKREKIVSKEAVILWNHRWEYDKNPDDFSQLLQRIDDLPWKLVLLGESFAKKPEVLNVIRSQFSDRILHSGHVSTDDYWRWVNRSDILPVTSIQDFFGGSVVEAMGQGVYPILPNRLAYPEHAPENCLYNGFEELVAKTRQAIADFLSLPDCSGLVEKYKWKNCISKYDLTFQTIIDDFGSKIVH